MTLDWQYVLPDNHRLMPARGRLIQSSAYRLAKKSAEIVLKSQWRKKPLDGPVELHARFWFPDLRRRDCTNYGKILCDALTGITFADDSQIHRAVYELAGIDRVRPRIEITVEPLEAA